MSTEPGEEHGARASCCTLLYCPRPSPTCFPHCPTLRLSNAVLYRRSPAKKCGASSVGTLGKRVQFCFRFLCSRLKANTEIQSGPVSAVAVRVRNRDYADLYYEDLSQQFVNYTQAIFSKACVRKKISSNGTKAVFIMHLCGKCVLTR